MQSLVRKLFLLGIFLVIVCACYSQDLSSFKREMRSVDSLSMLLASPGSFQKEFNNSRPLPSVNSVSARVNADIRVSQAASVSGAVCADTSWRYFLQKYPYHFYLKTNIRSADGSILSIGQYQSMVNNGISGGFLIKATEKGVVQWSRFYNNTPSAPPYIYCFYYNVLELKDGSLLLAGKSLNPANGHEDMMLTHTDKDGNILWNKTYASKLWISPGSGSPDYYYIVDMKEDLSTGDIFFTGPHWENGLNVTRMKINDGTLVWSNYYGGVSYDFNVPFGIDLHTNDLFVFSKYTAGQIQRSTIDKATGNALDYRYLAISDLKKLYQLGFTNVDQLIKMDNGHYLLSGKLYRYYISAYDADKTSPLAHGGIVEVDADFNFVKARYFSNGSEAYYPQTNTRVTIRKDGSGLFSMFGNFTTAQVYVQFQDDQILSQRTLSYTGLSISQESLSMQTGNGGDLIIKPLANYAAQQERIEFLNIHPSDTSSDCLGQKDNTNFIYPYQLSPSSRYVAPPVFNDFSESINRVVNVSDIVLDYDPACVQKHGCDTMSLVKHPDTICVSAPFTFTVRKSTSCNGTFSLDYNAAQVQSYTQVNDSLYSFNFKNAGTTTIYGSLAGCNLLKDSVKVVVMPVAPGKIDLGPDTAICPGNTIVLHAKPGFSIYSWQDGSTDSLFTVKLPGLYFVSAEDACGNIARDTVTVTTRSATPFDLGADTSLCERDSILLKAPVYSSYSWSPNYRISSLNTQNVFVFPLTDTIYRVKCEALPGCFVEDSLRIHVKHAPTINLGADKSFCYGDSLVLNAGTGFNSYTWSNGKTGQFTTVYNAGNYSVNALTQEGCKSADTMRVVSVYAAAQPDLGTDSIICTGTPRVISAGAYVQYAWNTGSNASTITVAQTGWYSVIVTDKNNCKGSDSIHISRIVNAPSNFLPADTSICTYGKIDLQANTTFDNYAWNTGANSAAISISKAGVYWLEIKDNNNCVGRDSIVVSSKDCMTGFYVPNAFSPGHDGKNDEFRPLIFGVVLQYEFTVYNRFGQIIFITKQPGKGWDGTSTQSSNAFVWTCRYQLENGPVKFEKGTVLLLK